MIEEYARHMGHADLLRERIDGRIGRVIRSTRDGSAFDDKGALVGAAARVALARRRLGRGNAARRPLALARVWLQARGRGGEGAQAHVRPGDALADQRRDAEGDGGRDLDRLEDDAVGERVGGGDVEALGEHADHGELEDPDVRRGGGDDRGDVDREQDRGGGADADLVVEAERGEQRPAGEQLQRPGAELGEGGERARAGLPEDG